jgi:hypothetical protein
MKLPGFASMKGKEENFAPNFQRLKCVKLTNDPLSLLRRKRKWCSGYSEK